MFSIERHGQPGIIGEVGVFVPDDRNEGDIGWRLNAKWQGKGFAEEAARGLLNWCFVVRRLTAHRLADHVALFRVLQRIGMRVELRSLESQLLNEVWRGEVGGAILQHEWMTRQI